MNDIMKAYEKTEEVGRKIWLAGLGAYGQSFDSMQGRYDCLSNETRGLFEKLVARGEQLEDQTRSAIKNTGENALKKAGTKIKEQGEKLIARGDKIQEMEGPSLEGISNGINRRLEEIRNLVNDMLPRMVIREELTTVNYRLDRLTESLKAASTRPKTDEITTSPKTAQSGKTTEAAEKPVKTTQSKTSRAKAAEAK